MVDIKNWKHFRVGDLFKVDYGKFISKSSSVGADEGVPHITTSEFNNGIGYYVSKAMYNGNCITVASDGSMGASFYQENPFSAGNIVSVLQPLDETPLTEKSALFLCVLLEKESQKYSWGDYKFSVERVRESKLPLPITSDGKPDWDYMESYMQQVMAECELKHGLLAQTGTSRHSVDIIEWKEFKVGDLFKKCDLRCKKNFNKAEDLSTEQDEEFDLPLVNAKHSNNGIMYYGRSVDWDSEEMTIDIVQNGAASVGDVYAQPQRTGVFYDAYLIKPLYEDITENELLFLSCIMKAMIKPHFSYDDKCTWDKVKAMYIKLPATLDAKPDWDYMEQYMQKIMDRQEHVLQCLSQESEVTANGTA